MLILLSVLLLVDNAICYKILVFAPKYGTSHTKFMAKVADTLVEYGHDVIVYAPNLHPNNFNMTTKAYAINPDFGIHIDMSSAQRFVWSSNIDTYIKLSKIVLKPVRELTKVLFASEDFHKWIREQKFDLAISEGVGPMDGLLHMCGIEKFVVTLSTNPIENFVEAMGVPSSLSFTPVNNKGFSLPMTYWERVQNLFEHMLTKTLIWLFFEPEFNGYLDEKFGKDVWSMKIKDEDDVTQRLLSCATHSPAGCRRGASGTNSTTHEEWRAWLDWQKQAAQISYIFVNNDEMIDFPRVITNKWHYIGGLMRQRPKPLSAEWEKVFASAKRGVIFMSFGTMARSTEMGEARRSAFVKAFQAFPNITFIWRYENTSDRFTNASNIILHEWLPQVDMLNDKRMLAFITHGGMGGVFESAYAGVPVITLPLFADQLRNARMMEYRGVGIVVDKDDVVEKRLISAIEEILQPRALFSDLTVLRTGLFDEVAQPSEPVYSEAARRLSEQLLNKAFSPEDILAHHVEYAIRFNVTASLNNVSADQTFVESLMLDIIIPFLFVAILVVIISVRITCAFFSMILRVLIQVRREKIKQN